jgi:hypothetical protein
MLGANKVLAVGLPMLLMPGPVLLAGLVWLNGVSAEVAVSKREAVLSTPNGVVWFQLMTTLRCCRV